MKTIYVVQGHWEYEGSELVQAFGCEKEAEAFYEERAASCETDRTYDYYSLEETKLS